jgi:hypothetical protein
LDPVWAGPLKSAQLEKSGLNCPDGLILSGPNTFIQVQLTSILSRPLLADSNEEKEKHKNKN